MIDLALHHTRAGYRVFPLLPDRKVPAIAKRDGGNGCLDATTNIETIERWWRAYPNANVGIATGRGLLVIDVDPRKTEKWLQSLHELALPQTFTVRTWSGGWHLYLAMPPTCKITIGADLLPGIDWRANNGYVVAAGSVVNGALYTVAKNLPIAAAPRSLLERIEATRKTRKIERDQDGHMVIPDSRRNDTLMRVGSALRRWGVDYNAILESLRAVNIDHCDPPLEDAELRHIAGSVSRYKPNEPKGAA